MPDLYYHEGHWRFKHRQLISDLVAGGHILRFETYADEKGSPNTIMQCAKCHKAYMGRLLSRWFGLSSDRPCEGTSTVIPRATDLPPPS